MYTILELRSNTLEEKAIYITCLNKWNITLRMAMGQTFTRHSALPLIFYLLVF